LSPAKDLIGTADDLLEVVDGAAEQLPTLGLGIERELALGHQFPQRLRQVVGDSAP
jgi:hypothetical protein